MSSVEYVLSSTSAAGLLRQLATAIDRGEDPSGIAVLVTFEDESVVAAHFGDCAALLRELTTVETALLAEAVLN